MEESVLTPLQKEELKKELVLSLVDQTISRIVVFGSFISSDSPHDMDVAVFQDSGKPYLPLAMEYRRRTRTLSRKIPIDIFPVSSHTSEGHSFLKEIEAGETVYER
jgi:uncharacterized protein